MTAVNHAAVLSIKRPSLSRAKAPQRLQPCSTEHCGMRNALLALSCCIKAAAAMSPREALAKRVVASPAPVLAPLTRAGTAPFRALCRRHGADATMGEMIFARQYCKGDRREQARLRRPEAETLFGAQIATNQISEGVAACVLAEEAGAAWVDLNCGCPILRENQTSGAPRDHVPVTASTRWRGVSTPPARRCAVTVSARWREA